MRRKLKLLWAHVRCEWYLWTDGMWRGERKLTAEHADGRTAFVTAALLTFKERPEMRIVRYFYLDPQEQAK